MRCRLKAAGIPLLLFCLGTLVTRAEGIGGNADSLKAIRLLTLSEKATDEHHAIAYALSSLSIGFRTKNHTVIAQSYRQLASCYRNVRAPQLLELDSLAVSYDALQLIVKDFLNSNQTKKAALYLPLLDSIATLSNRHYSLSVASQLRSFYYYKKFQPRQALVYAQKSLAHALESTDRLLQVRLLSQVGQLFWFG